MFKLIAILIVISVRTSASVCPLPEDIYPCSCYGTGKSLSGMCIGFQSEKELYNSVKGFLGIKLDTFEIKDSRVNFIPYNVFENATIRNLIISKSNLSRIGNLGDPQFEGLENSLESIAITSTFTSVHPFAYVNMGHLQKLRSLELRKNHVEVFHNEWFKYGPTSLEVLRFVEGQIRVVGYRALDALPNLKIVDLSDNAISYVPRSLFPEVSRFLEELNLERNKLDHLPSDFFEGMPSLKIVNLELNEFSTIDERLWGPVWGNLLSVNIDYNPLVCDKHLKWIYEAKEGRDLEEKLIATCFKPFHLMERELHTLTVKELKGDEPLKSIGILRQKKFG